MKKYNFISLCSSSSSSGGGGGVVVVVVVVGGGGGRESLKCIIRLKNYPCTNNVSAEFDLPPAGQDNLPKHTCYYLCCMTGMSTQTILTVVKRYKRKEFPEDSSCQPSATLEGAVQDTKHMNVWKHGSQERMLEAEDLSSWY
jgi:hypothetical protein